MREPRGIPTGGQFAAQTRAEPDVPLDPLRDLADRGYVIDGFSTWQQGECLTYAQALINANPNLRGATLAEPDGDALDGSTGWTPVHHFAHDDEYAYDSLGRHRLPYHGVGRAGNLVFLDDDLDDYDEPYDDLLPAAAEHIAAHDILNRTPVV